MKQAKKCKNTVKGRQKHGLHQLKRAVKQLGGRTIDGRTSIGKALLQWQNALIADLGGIDAVSTQQLSLVDVATRTKLILDSVDAWILKQSSVVNARKKSLLPVVRERQSLANALSQYLNLLGLERRQGEALTLQEYLARNSNRGRQLHGGGAKRTTDH